MESIQVWTDMNLSGLDWIGSTAPRINSKELKAYKEE